MSVRYADLLQWLENSIWAVTIRQSAWLYPALEVVHLVGIVLLVGAAFMFDLRLLGYTWELPVKALANHLLTWSRRGLLLVIPSGMLLFITDASVLGYDLTFWFKMTLLLLAGLNALVFHQYTLPSVSVWNSDNVSPKGAKFAAVFSILLWVGVIVCGRWLAY
ncbi:hypothetical protein AAE02nite_01380 [Adhaeribacter aerolatus]|uniref:DUF6644 domain-containing protein n=1 Tax=Adhaeribacter aerolatus TaxID=670289 RepID=A0A512ARY8_9BACT|nr:DUF6644 family protein [Adhaeribacter aerolatus]GEO02474.1 hypothetical protein AAE02nite_01380 [Adhaeribacter aerolatus]